MQRNVRSQRSNQRPSPSETSPGVNPRPFLPVGAPALVGNEKAYVNDCLDSTWISSNGAYIGRFEEGFAEFCQVPHALSCSNGTVALHLALLALDIGPGDEVIVPTLTYVATANSVLYCGAKPVFVDCEADTWNMGPAAIAAKITPRTKAIVVVHLFGHPVDMDPIMALAERHGVAVIEDAAEAHGAEYKGRRVGGIGHLATFSFYGNKIITTGEGGMVVTKDPALARRVRQLKGQGQDFERRYWFPIVGYNYRMTNIQAAIGLAQLERIDWHLGRRLENAAWYRTHLDGHPQLAVQAERPWARSVSWMNCVVLGPDVPLSRDEVMVRLLEEEIETRPFFYPSHTMPVYQAMAEGEAFPVAESVAARGINLPSGAGLREADVKRVCESLIALTEAGR